MAKSATLAIKIVSDAKSAGAGFDAAESRLDKFRGGLDKASIAAGGVIAGLVAVGKQAYESASNLQQSAGAVDAVFGAASAKVHQLAKDAAQSVGLAESEYGNLAAVLGSQLANMGFHGDRLAKQVASLIGLGADLSAQYGGTTADAVEALSGVLKGETDPIERYGVSIKQSDINARLAAQGQDKLTGAAGKAATAQAVLGLLSAQTQSAVGAFGREADTAAGQTQRAAAEFENAQAALGTALLPVVTAAAIKLGELARWAGENQGAAQALALVIGGLAAAVIAVNVAMSTYTAATRVAAAVQWLLNAALDANPLTIIIIAIVAVVAAVVIMYNKFAWVRDFIQGVFMVLMVPVNLFMGLIHAIGDAISLVGHVFEMFGQSMQSSLNPIIKPLGWIVDKVGWLISKGGDVLSWVGGLFSAPAGPPSPAPAPAGQSGVYGAALGAAPVRAAPMGGGAAAVGAPGGAGLSGPTIQVTVNGALDPVAVGRQLVSVLRRYGITTGGQSAVQIGSR